MRWLMGAEGTLQPVQGRPHAYAYGSMNGRQYNGTLLGDPFFTLLVQKQGQRFPLKP